MHPLLQTARPRQWLKNTLVVAAPGAAGVLDDPSEVGRVALAFVAFCLGASGTYFWNDVLDAESDRDHPVKSARPMASGRLSPSAARWYGTALIAVSLPVMAGTGRWEAVAVLAVYHAVTLSYSLVWKHVAVIDLAAIAAGFVLRAAGGAAAVAVPMSAWFVLVTTFGSLYVVTGKRFAELRQLGPDAPDLRATLGDYTEGFLRFVLAVAAGSAVVSYCMWAFETKQIAASDLSYYELSIIPFVIAFLRYGLALERGHGAAPEEVFGRDRVLQVLGALWVLVFGLAVYS